MVLSREDGLLPTTSSLEAPGSRPGPLTHGRGDAVPWCPSSMAWPSLLGSFQLRNPFAFALQCEPDVGHLHSAGQRPLPEAPYQPPSPSAPGEGVPCKLVAQSPSLSPAPLTPALHSSWHLCIFPPYQQEMTLDRSQKSICLGQSL